MKSKKRIPYIWLGPIVTLGIMLVLYWAGGIYPFGTATTAFSDGIAQYVPFLSELSRKITEGGSLLYSWNMGNGANFWVNIGYYLANPINIIAVFFEPDNMDKCFALITLIKPSILALTFGIFLKHTYKKNDLSLVIFSVLWAMSGFMLGGIFITSWFDAIIYFPLVIMGLNKMMNGGSAWVYSLFLGLTIASNFYIGWMTCIFCVIYFVYCFISDDSVVYEGKVTEDQQDDETESVNIFAVFKNSYLLGSIFKFGFASLLAGAISAIMTLPMVSALQETGKGTVTNVTFNFHSDGIWGILASHIFPFANNYSTLSTLDCVFAFAGIGTLILAVAYFFTKGISIRKKIGNLFLLAILWLSMIFHDIYFVWHGFGEPVGLMYRFAFIYSFVLIKIAYEAFCEIEKIKWYGILAGTVFSALCVAGIYFSDLFNFYFFSAKLVVILVIFIVVFAVLLLVLSKNIKAKTIIMAILVLCVAVESIVLNFNNINTLESSENLSEYEIIDELTANIDDSKTVHFESKKQTYKDMLMYGAIFGNRSLECYSSVSDYHFALTVTDFGTYGNRLNMQNGAGEQTPVFNMFFPISYYIDGTGHLKDSFFREKVTEKDGYTLYKNNYTMPFMYTTSYDIAEWDPFSFPIVIDNLNESTKCITGTTENVVVYNNPENFVYENCTHISAVDRVESNNDLIEEHDHDHEHDHGDNTDSINSYYEFLEKRMSGYSYTITDMTKPAYITFDSVAQADGMMYLYVDTSEFTDLTVTLNGQTTEYNLFGVRENTTYELGEVKKGDIAKITIGGYRDSGIESDEIYVLKNGFFTINSYTVDKAKFENAYNTLDAMSDTELLEFEDTYVKAKVTSYTDGALYIPITFDKGWKIFVDGQQVGLYEHQSHILMTGISKGEHIVEMKYCPVGFVPGAVITGVSVAILVAWAVIATKRSKKEELCVTINETSVNEE
ncbi:MAG: YfhO family protein [Clostridia bacterium]|nr:YfhO family protein [Clostridia bacterium]